ncbi:ATP-dependent DNA helicase RecQ [Janthinobacterium lividum]|uniref:protein DpdF n=1 Tax=Janthinobacterium lividum TaxID=29581 RepID=UPI001596190C|nr:protein DpdF [Janthinobacterium lividum]QKY02427.1 ATP-dependent DNA helicase RecQ [Janthinobacterium lividum]
MMNVYEGEAAYTALRVALGDPSTAASFKCDEVPFERLRRAIADERLSPLDRAIRLRHALRHADLTLSAGGVRRALPHPTGVLWPTAQQCATCGLVLRAGNLVEAEPWRPDWLEHGAAAVDTQAMQQQVRPWIQRLPEADRWIKARFGYQHYRGPGQALAVRSALHMLPGQALLAILPTGEGKSLVFQALAAAHPGQVVAVVVPTVALAQDHDNSVSKYGEQFGTHTHAYVGGQDQQNAEIIDRIGTGEQGLVFAAPEAFVGRLQPALLRAAKAGKLAAVVIDEAHLIDAWGTDFRNEFQLLAALVAELQTQAPVRRQSRLLCLSATVTQLAYDTLQRLFSPHAPLALVAGARLRPEPDTWVARMAPDEATRKARVLEAVMHLPRPAILYVTKVEDVQDWYQFLFDHGLRRMRTVHGKSSPSDRSATVKAWSTGELDLVIGTSAFGLGIDYPHVRTVIHACIPESLDRYYQEVGRSGRDNHASIVLLVPAPVDGGVAHTVSAQKIISVEKGLARWSSMFSYCESDTSADAERRFSIDTSVPPPYDMDMMGERNEDWNGRVLSLMARAGLIAFAGLRFNPAKMRTNVVVDILDDGHHDPVIWQTHVEPVRQTLLRTSRERLRGMLALTREVQCPSQRLINLYALNNGVEVLPVVPACGGCAACRAAGEPGWFADWPNPPAAPWPAGGLSPRLLRQIVHGRGLIERDTESFDKSSQRRFIRDVMNGLWDDGVRKCLVIGSTPTAVDEALTERPWCTAQANDAKLLSSNGLPPGPVVVWVGAGMSIPEHNFSPRKPGQERLFIVPEGLSNPDRPGCVIGDQLPMATLNSLYESLQT